jgi:hypothetical protein
MYLQTEVQDDIEAVRSEQERHMKQVTIARIISVLKKSI